MRRIVIAGAAGATAGRCGRCQVQVRGYERSSGAEAGIQPLFSADSAITGDEARCGSWSSKTKRRLRTALQRAGRGGLCRRLRRRWRAGGLSRPDRALRRGRARPRPAARRWAHRPAPLARGGPGHARCLPDGARQLAREGPGHRQRRRRLSGQAVPDGRAARAAARAHPARQRTDDARAQAPAACRSIRGWRRSRSTACRSS